MKTNEIELYSTIARLLSCRNGNDIQVVAAVDQFSAKPLIVASVEITTKELNMATSRFIGDAIETKYDSLLRFWACVLPKDAVVERVCDKFNGTVDRDSFYTTWKVSYTFTIEF